MMRNNYEIQVNNMYSESEGPDDVDYIPLFGDDNEDMLPKVDYPDTIPVLPIKNTVLFPGVVLPVSLSRQKSIKLVKDVYDGNKLIGVLTQKDHKIEDPEFKDLYTTGTVGQIIKVLEMPDGGTTVIIQGRKRFKVLEQTPHKQYFRVKYQILENITPDKKDKEFGAQISSIKDLALKIIQQSGYIPQEAAFAIKNIDSPSFLINFICSNSTIQASNKQKLIEIDELKSRAFLLMELLNKELKSLELRNEVQSKVKFDIDQQQREYFLQQQMRTIQDELGGDPSEVEISELEKKAKRKKWSKTVQKLFEKELKKLDRIHPASGEYSTQLTYLQTLVEIPWGVYTKDNFDLVRAQKVLDQDHTGLDKVKERIIEHLAVLKLKGNLKAPILCLYGPPGVGKTSLGNSVAKALDRKYVRMSLGGLHDEAEIRGHRKTYIGALPGRIIQSLKRVNSSNPVFVLDEIDKIGNDFRGDPSAALLEVLDPEQNKAFYDNYLELEYDLSKVLFIATANNIGDINPALRDRLELIEVGGYIVEEKIEIAQKHMMPKLFSEHGVRKTQLDIPKDSIEFIVENYTRESGVRELNKRISKIIRANVKKIALSEKFTKQVSKDDIVKILGAPIYSSDKYQGNEYAGVVTGLAWTSMGGEILFVETSISEGKEMKLTLTGNLGDVMKESAVIALEYLKSHAKLLDLTTEKFTKWNIHVHVPEGAIPKDGPSAGVTMVTSIASAFTQRKVRENLAMTGEITLRGKVLPVGGIKEKILAAKRAGITDIVISIENKKDIEEINEKYLKGLTFHYVKDISEVLEFALLPEKVKNPIEI